MIATCWSIIARYYVKGTFFDHCTIQGLTLLNALCVLMPCFSVICSIPVQTLMVVMGVVNIASLLTLIPVHLIRLP